MPLDFPDSPTNGQQYTSGTRTWQYDSANTAWGLVASGIVGPTGPSLPVGTLLMWAGTASGGSAPAYTSLPSGFLLCDGSAISRSTYSALFSAIGTRYGVGNNSTTFNIPTLTAQIPHGLTAGSNANNNTDKNTTVQSADHTHNITVWQPNDTTGFSVTTKASATQSADHTHSFKITSVYYLIKF